MADERGGPVEPYVDFELCFTAEQSQLALARSVAAEIACTEGAELAYVEQVRLVAGKLTAALLVLADPEEPVRCAFRVLDSEIRLSVSVRGSSTAPSPEAKSEHAKLLDELLVPACTCTRRDDSGEVCVVSDAFIPLTA
jgi:hypothetical protein